MANRHLTQLRALSEKEKKLAGLAAEIVSAWACWVVYLEGKNGVVVGGGGVGGNGDGDGGSLRAFFRVEPTPPFSLSQSFSAHHPYVSSHRIHRSGKNSSHV